jgi:parvulin-like peptidyl-prolyl isomerase
MKTPRLAVFWLAVILFVMVFIFTACGGEKPAPTATVTAVALTAAAPEPTVTPTAVPPTPTPTPTPEPLAALVNGEGITLAEYQAEIARYKLAQKEDGTNLATDDKVISQQVLDDLIDQTLFSQAARAEGFTADEALVQSRIDQLAEKLGSQQAVLDWTADNGYTASEFRLALKRSVEAAWMRDQIIQGQPDQVEQIHARQILLYNLEDANQVLAQLRSGQDFTRMASVYNPTTGGDLGWFPRGILLDDGLEEIAFQLQPEQYSEIIETQAGYHILQVIERSTERALDASARLILQENILKQWLQNRREQSDVQIIVQQ